MGKCFRLKVFSIFLVLIMFLGILISSQAEVSAAGTTYYVDSVSGNDSNNGTSISTAWKTLAKVNSITFQAGDSILFKAGCYWSGQLKPQGSGAAGSPIVADKYGTGEKPIIDGAGASCTVELNGQQYWEFNNLHVKNYTTDLSQLRMGFYFHGTDCGIMNHIYIKNCDIGEIVSRGTNYWGGSHEGMGTFSGCLVMRIFGNTTQTKYNDIVIEDNYFYDGDRNAIYMVDSPWKNFKSSNVVIRNNTVENMPGDGFCICACDGAIIENNSMNHMNLTFPIHLGSIPMSTWDCDNCVFQFNEVCNVRGYADCQAFDIDGWSNDCIVQYNYSHNAGGGFFNVCTDSSCPSTGAIARYNISQNDGKQDSIFFLTAYSTGTKIYNNTIYRGLGSNGIFFGRSSGTASFFNNIIYNRGASLDANKGSYTWDGNVFYGSFSSYPNDANKLTSDPMILAPGLGRDTIESAVIYKLKEGSPCIDSGVTVSNSGSRDFFGNTIYNGLPDRGAHEYTNDTGYVPSGLNAALYNGATANAYYATESPDMSVDGKMGTKWHTSENPGAQWLKVDLGQDYTIDRWVVKHAEAGGEPSIYNTKDFKLQKSSDGSAWTDVDSVTGNTADITDRTVTAFTARYVRLYITIPTNGAGNGSRIYEFEVYTGIPSASTPTPTPTPGTPSPTPTPTPTPTETNVALNKTATAVSYWDTQSPDKAVDGTVSVASKWCCASDAGAQWLKVDLGQDYTINRWVVKHAEAAGEDAGFNTKDFKLQKSSNGSTWTDVDSVTGNTAGITDRTVTAFTARYVRLFITIPANNGNTSARIPEFEVYNQ